MMFLPGSFAAVRDALWHADPCHDRRTRPALHDRLLLLAILLALLLPVAPGGSRDASHAQDLSDIVVRLDTATVSGRTAPAARITLRVLRAGEELGSWSAAAREDGAFAIAARRFEGAMPVAFQLRAGDVLLLDVNGGDPSHIEVPELSVHVDAETGTVFGAGPAGHDVEIEWFADGARAMGTTRVGPDGAYRLGVEAVAANRRPLWGRVYVLLDEGQRVALPWSLPSVDLWLGGATLSGVAAPDETLDVVLRDGAGRHLAAGTGHASGDGRYHSPLVDGLGQPVRIASGDELLLRTRAQTTSRIVPQLDVTVDVALDLVSGRTSPGVTLRLLLERRDGIAPVAPVESPPVASDARGEFQHAFGAGPGIRNNDVVAVTMADDFGETRREAYAPGFRVALHAGQAEGVAREAGSIELVLERDGAVLERLPVVAAEDGTFQAALLAATPERLPLRAGDVIRVESASARGGEAQAIEIPELAVDLDPARDAVHGYSPGAEVVSLHASDAYGPDAETALLDGDAARGLWTASFHAYDLRPGSLVSLAARLRTGDVLESRLAVPLLDAWLGSNVVCAVAEPHSAVSATLLSATGTELGAGSAVASADGTAELRVRGRDGREVRLQAGQRVRLRVDDEASVAHLAGLSVQLSADLQSIEGRTRPRGTIVTSASIQRVSCRGGPSRSGLKSFETIADGAGAFSILLRGDARQNLMEGVELAQEIIDDAELGGVHRERLVLRSVLADIELGRGRMDGLAMPGGSVQVEVLDGDAEVLARARAQAAADGTLRLELAREEIARAQREGRSLRFTTTNGAYLDGAVVDEIALPPLSMDVTAGRSVVGVAPPEAEVQVRLELADGSEVPLRIPADETGRWSLAAEDASPRSPWAWEDIRCVQAELRLAGGQRLIERWCDGSGGRENRVWLPFAGAGQSAP